MQIGLGRDDIERSIEAVVGIVDPVVHKLRAVRRVAVVAAVVATLAFWWLEAFEGGVRTAAALLTLAAALVPALAMTVLVRGLQGTVEDIRGVTAELRSWSDGDARRKRVAELRRRAAELRATRGLPRQVLAGLSLVRDLRRTAGGVAGVRALSPSMLVSGYVWVMALGIGLLGTAVVCWVALGMTFLRTTGQIG